MVLDILFPSHSSISHQPAPRVRPPCPDYAVASISVALHPHACHKVPFSPCFDAPGAENACTNRLSSAHLGGNGAVEGRLEGGGRSDETQGNNSAHVSLIGKASDDLRNFLQSLKGGRIFTFQKGGPL